MGTIISWVEATGCGTRDTTLVQILVGAGFVPTERVESAGEGFLRSTELYHTRLKIAERSFDKGRLLLVMCKEVQPERVLQNFSAFIECSLDSLPCLRPWDCPGSLHRISLVSKRR